MSRKQHPYQRYENQPVWRVLDRAIKSLVKNGDVQEKTSHPYLVGYLAKVLTDAGFRQVSELRTGQRTVHVVELAEAEQRAAG